jgi:steroid delta-isomerase-like uncharacterized protein
MDADAVRAMLRTQIERIWGAGETDLVDAVYADDVVDRMPIPGQPTGREALKDVVRLFRTAMPDLRMHLHGALACGDLGVDFWTLTGTHTGPLGDLAATGRAVAFSGIDMIRVRDGRVAELWHVEEMLQFREQLGLGGASFGAPTKPAPVPPTLDPDYRPGAGARTPDPARLSAQEARRLAVARRHIEELWAKGDMGVALEVYAPDVVDRNPAPGQRPGLDGILDVLTWLREAAPDLRMRIEAFVVDGDYAADRWVMAGTHTGAPLMGLPAQGKAFTINGMDVVKFNAEDRITDVWHVEEFESLRAQIK